MLIKYEILKETLEKILLSRNVLKEDAESLAEIFANNSLDGVYSHGANRFPRLIEYMDKGEINPTTKPNIELEIGSLCKMNGNLGIGPLNAKIAMDKACDLAKVHGIGLVMLGNTNHWMRGGTYGLEAANRGMIGICFSNTTANMPVWGGMDPKLGNNPLVISVPRSNGKHVVCDMAISQYSYGKVEQTRLLGKQLPYPGGFDSNGNLTCDPTELEKTKRFLPIGYWKGSGLSLVLDLIATILTGGNSVADITKLGDEVALSQIFIAIDPSKVNSSDKTNNFVEKIIADIKSSIPVKENGEVYYPGELSAKTREENLEKGIPVVDEVWAKIQSLIK